VAGNGVKSASGHREIGWLHIKQDQESDEHSRCHEAFDQPVLLREIRSS